MKNHLKVHDFPVRLNEQGTAMFMTILILTGILTVALGVANLLAPRMIMSRTQNYSTKAYFASEAGAERALWEIRYNNYAGAPGPNIFGTTTLSNASFYTVDYATSSSQTTMTSNGVFQGTRRVIKVQY